MGHNTPGYSTGAVYVDLNNNGALDLVVNNTNEPASIYRNQLLDNNENDLHNWLKIELNGVSKNRGGLGTVIDLFFENGTRQKYDHTVYRGYLSSTDPKIHMGLNTQEKVDSLIISYHLFDDKFSKTYKNVDANNTLFVDLKDFSIHEDSPQKNIYEPLFRDITEQLIPDNGFNTPFQSYNDFVKEPLSLYKRSERGPASAVGDISGNGLSDIFIGPSIHRSAYILYQQDDGTFNYEEPAILQFDLPEYMLVNAAELFDANGNGFADLYLGLGTRPGFTEDTYDRLYLNDGSGGFSFDQKWLPQISGNSMTVVSHDINNDGRLDLFIGGGSGKQVYPVSEGHIVLINQSKGSSNSLFMDKTEEFAPYFINDSGIINDAVWADITGDGSAELITAGEWDPIRVHQFDGAVMTETTSLYELQTSAGFWNTLFVSDLNNDGVQDIIAGNWGTNNLFETSENYPMQIYFGDMTGNGFSESVPTYYSLSSEGDKIEFPYHHREDFMRYIPAMIQTYPTNEQYGNAFMQEVLSVFKGDYQRKQVYTFETSSFLSQADGTYLRNSLPAQAQFGPVFGVHVDRENTDTVMIAGNIRGGDVYSGSLNGIESMVFTLHENGEQRGVSINDTGIHQEGYGRAIHQIISPVNKNRYVFVYDDGQVRVFEKQITTSL